MKRSRRLQGLSPACFPSPAWRQKKSKKSALQPCPEAVPCIRARRRSHQALLWKSGALQPCPDALALGAVVIGDAGELWVEDVVGTREASMHSGAFCTREASMHSGALCTREASMHSGAFSTPADSVALGGFDALDDLVDLGGFDPADFEAGAGPCKADRWSEVETETLDDLVDLGGFDPADFEVGAGPCELGDGCGGMVA